MRALELTDFVRCGAPSVGLSRCSVTVRRRFVSSYRWRSKYRTAAVPSAIVVQNRTRPARPGLKATGLAASFLPSVRLCFFHRECSVAADKAERGAVEIDALAAALPVVDIVGECPSHRVRRAR